MCGITGFFSQKNTGNIEVLRVMVDQQSHRGPDAEGFFFEEIGEAQVALGHRRLSIIDISHQASQPMKFENLTIVYNGEVYNFAEIRLLLQKEGYEFHSESDTEVVLKAFHFWGVKCVEKFRGMFSFCIFDKNNKKAFLFRDRAGVKPLYYYHDSHNFLFSSEIKSLRFHPAFKNKISDRGLNMYFQYGYVPAPWTMFEGTQKINAGHFVEYDLVNNTYVENKYWDMASYYHLPKIDCDENSATEELHKILTDSFSLRMISDVPVGVLLSGGIDSSLVTAILQSNSSKSLETFTIGFESQEFDESEHARKIAAYLGTSHNEQICTWKDSESIISLLPKMYDEPLADPSAIPTALVSRFAKRKVTVALSGDGGDEMFCGYSSYLLNQRRFERISKIPYKKVIAKILNFIPDPMMKFYKFDFDGYSRYLKLKSLIPYDHIEAKYRAVIRTFSPYDITRLLSGSQMYEISNSCFDQLESLERMMLMDFNHYLPDDLLVKVDRASMFYSLEGREPLLDHKILEYAAQLPMNYKLKKSILKKILAKYLPAEYFERKKQGFGVPINKWLRNELGYLIKKYLNIATIKKQNIFNPSYIYELCKSFVRSSTDDNKVWTLLVFQIWYEEYFGEIF